MRLTLRSLFVALLFLAVFIMTLRPIADPDFWWHLRTGQLILDTHSIPHTDPFSFTNSGKPWIAHEWLSELLIYCLYRLGGFGLPILAFSALITTAFILVYLRTPEKPYVAGFALLLGALATAPTWGVRPQMISLLLSSLFLFLLDRHQVTRRTIFLLPLPAITLLWVNLHAGFALGLGMIGIYLLGELIQDLVPVLVQQRKEQPGTLQPLLWLGGILLVCILMVMINPNGVRMYTYPFETLTSPSMQQFIQEWFSPDFHQIEWQPLAWLILALIAVGLIGRRSIPPTKILLILVFGYATLRSMRNVPLFAIAAIPVLAEQAGALVKFASSELKQARLLNWLNPLLLAIMVLATGARFVSAVGQQSKTEREQFPAAAVDWIVQNKPAGELYNTYGWGGYLIWRLYPQSPVYIDGRADVYGDAFIYDYLSIYRAEPGWMDKLAAHQVGVILIEPKAPLANALRASPGWQVAFEDSRSVLFIPQR